MKRKILLLAGVGCIVLALYSGCTANTKDSAASKEEVSDDRSEEIRKRLKEMGLAPDIYGYGETW